MRNLTPLQKELVELGLRQKKSREEILQMLTTQHETAKLAIKYKKEVFKRNVFKRSTMTVSAYSAQLTSVRKNTVTELAKTNFLKTANKAQITQLARDVFNQINFTMESSTAYKQFAQRMLKDVLKSMNKISYTCPLNGFPVRLKINVLEKRNIHYKNLATKRRTAVCLIKDTGVIDKRKTVSSSVPSIIHSLDAAILMKTCELFDSDMAVIHDSFGTTCEDLVTLKERVKESLVMLYEADALTDISHQMGYKEEVPTYGLTADFSEVIRESKYCFN